MDTDAPKSPPATPVRQPANLFSNVSAGLISAFVMLSFAVSYGTLAFHDPLLQPYAKEAIYAALTTTWVLLLVNTFFSSFHFSLAGPDSNSTILLALLASSIAERLAQENASPECLQKTVLMAFGIASIMVGFFSFVLGGLKQGRRFCFIPFPVTAGFLAGTGLLVIGGSLKVLLGKAPDVHLLQSLLSVPPLNLGITTFVALGLLIIPRFFKHFLTMPLVILSAIGLFQIFCATGKSLLPLVVPSHLTDTSLVATLYSGIPASEIRWDIIGQHWTMLFPLAMVVILTSLVNSAGLDVASSEDGDFDRELCGIGLALVASGLLGGFLGHTSASRSILHRQAGATSRLGGFCAALICFLVTFFVPSWVFSFPKPVLAGMLLAMGLSMLREWIWESYRKFKRDDYFVIVLIFLIIAFYGPLIGVFSGILITTIMFVYNYSRINCIRHQFSIGDRFSNKDRPVQQVMVLRQLGKFSQIIELQGFLFFGTSNSVLSLVRELLEKHSCKFLLLEFRMVQSLDASAIFSFVKLEQICRRLQTPITLTGLRPELQEALLQAGLRPNGQIQYAPDLDWGLELIEEQLLEKLSDQGSANLFQQALYERLHEAPDNGSSRDRSSEESAKYRPFGKTGFFPFGVDSQDNASSGVSAGDLQEMDARKILAPYRLRPATLDLLLSHCETQDWPEGHLLFKKGEMADSMFFIERGNIAILVPKLNGETKRLRALGPGSVIGEMSLYTRQARSAEARVQSACRVRRLSAEEFERLSRENPEACNEFHSFIVKLLSLRLASANAQIVALS